MADADLRAVDNVQHQQVALPLVLQKGQPLVLKRATPLLQIARAQLHVLSCTPRAGVCTLRQPRRWHAVALSALGRLRWCCTLQQ